jgi:hypothetical protein
MVSSFFNSLASLWNVKGRLAIIVGIASFTGIRLSEYVNHVADFTIVFACCLATIGVSAVEYVIKATTKKRIAKNKRVQCGKTISDFKSIPACERALIFNGRYRSADIFSMERLIRLGFVRASNGEFVLTQKGKFIADNPGLAYCVSVSPNNDGVETTRQDKQDCE